MNEAQWRKYKSDFLKANRCTADEFEQAYIAFMESKPDTKAYRRFARKYRIRIHLEPRLPDNIQVVLAVSISAIKVMAKSEIEAYNAIAEIISNTETRH